MEMYTSFALFEALLLFRTQSKAAVGLIRQITQSLYVNLHVIRSTWYHYGGLIEGKTVVLITFMLQLNWHAVANGREFLVFLLSSLFSVFCVISLHNDRTLQIGPNLIDTNPQNLLCFIHIIIISIGEPVNLAGDGRYDCPGHSARYCTYTLMDAVSSV